MDSRIPNVGKVIDSAAHKRVVRCIINMRRRTKFDFCQKRSATFGWADMAGRKRKARGRLISRVDQFAGLGLRPIAGDHEIRTPLVNGTHKLSNVVGSEVPQ
jgi:hypothetical protein